jgi:aminoglycoside phosphotransferase family enzyme
VRLHNRLRQPRRAGVVWATSAGYAIVTIANPPTATKSLDQWLRTIEASASGSVEVVESDLSWVFLTERHAYKIKKPVDVGEARFRDPARRRAACLDELWLNRRLAGDIYLGVVPVTLEFNGELRLGGHGEPVEWAIKMRRLRAERGMLWLITHGELKPVHITMLAEVLADFYRRSPPQTVLLDDLCARLRARIEDRESITPPWPAEFGHALTSIRAAQSDFLEGARPMLNLRVCDGRVVDGHGDLRPEHTFLERRPVIIDCAEYSPLRRRTDALDDLSALTMECQRLGRDDVAETLTATYRAATKDGRVPQLEAFYRSLHASARAAASAAAEGSWGAECDAYLAQAHRDARAFA